MWTYLIRTGALYQDSTHVATGHSGWGEYANDPRAVARKALGPIPPGAYWVGEPRTSPKTGPFALPLIPVLGTRTYGRSGFQIHGDNRTPEPFDASNGCIVMDRVTRERIDASGDRLLTVLTGDEGFIASRAIA